VSKFKIANQEGASHRHACLPMEMHPSNAFTISWFAISSLTFDAPVLP